MTPEILSLIGGGAAGFVFRMIGAMTEYQNAHVERALKVQTAVDDSADRAAVRDPGSWVRRFIVIAIFSALLIIPMVMAFAGMGITVEGNPAVIWNPLTWANDGLVEIKSWILLEEYRVALLAIIGFYFGGAAAPRR
jgi:hypothetical protein